MSWCYNLLLLLGGCAILPKWLLQKKYRGTVAQRWGLVLPPRVQGTPVFWLHMVSMGETRAMIPLYQKLQTAFPEAVFYLSSTTKTGHEEAKRRFPQAAAHFFLPLDLSWNMKRLVKQLQPTFLLLSESDFWYNLIRMVKRGGGKVAVLNGKISARSHSRFQKASFVSEKLFSPVDLFCVQNEEYKDRFLTLPIAKEKVAITGNLKLAIKPALPSEEQRSQFCRTFGINPSDRLVTIGSTHPKEEELLLEQCAQVKGVKFLLVPRHPERFAGVKKWLSTLGNDTVILIDQMGVLNLCYQLSDIALVGGSFVPGIGGHNIFEPIQAQIPVLFGPYMENQNEFTQMVLKAKAGLQIGVDEVGETLTRLLQDPAPYRDNAKKLSLIGDEVLEETWNRLKTILPL